MKWRNIAEKSQVEDNEAFEGTDCAGAEPNNMLSNDDNSSIRDGLIITHALLHTVMKSLDASEHESKLPLLPN